MPCLGNAQEETSDLTFAKADALYQTGDFASSALEYERVIFQATTIEIVNTALFGRVRCFKQMQQFGKALDELLRIRLFSLNQKQAVEYHYEKILCYYLMGSFNEARGAIDEMYLNITDSESRASTLLLQTFIYNELQQWEEAKQTALAYVNTFPSPQKDSMEAVIHQMYSKNNLPKLKKEKTSKVLAFVPGLAHIYAGYWTEGITSFLLNSAALAFGVYEVLNGYNVTGYLVGAGVLSLTYFGSLQRASFLLNKSNHETVSSFNNNVKKELLAL